MQDNSAAAAHAGFVIPEDEYVGLIQLHQHLRLLSQLLHVGGPASEADARMRPDALAWWFTRICLDIEKIVDATYWLELPSEK